MGDNELTAAAGRGELPVVRVENDSCVGEVYHHGATVTAWQPAGQESVIFVSADAVFDGEKAIRGGVPICFPWFGTGWTGDMSPQHGWARTSPWQFDKGTRDGGTTELGFSMARADATCRYVVRMGATLELSLTVTAGPAGYEMEEALHTYLVVGDVREVQLLGLEASTYRDKTDDFAMKDQEGPVTISGETDRVYATAAEVTVNDPVMGRRLIVASQGAKNTVVWNPWREKAAAMADLGDEEWTGMVCVEAANVLEDRIVLRPGQSHTLTQTVTVL